MNSSLSAEQSRRAGYVLHVMTASGAVAGMFALESVISGHLRAALLWLIVCQVLDGLDGPIARKLDVTIHASRIDGHILDLVVDYLTCVVVPVALLLSQGLLPAHYATAVAALILLSSALWFARTDQETSDNWFNGFPAVWNLVIPTLLIIGADKDQVLIVSVILCALQLTNFKIPHLVRVGKFRNLTLPLTALYLIDLTYLSWNFSELSGAKINQVQEIFLVAFPIYIGVLSIWRTWFFKISTNEK
jgi:phosphatidylcholine synthase